MISVVKNKEGYVSAYIEWEVLDENGQFKDGGDCIYIQDLWIHEELRGKKILNTPH